MATYLHNRLHTTEFPTADMDNDWCTVHDESALSFHPAVYCHDWPITVHVLPDHGCWITKMEPEIVSTD
jgi:hypothetical protein